MRGRFTHKWSRHERKHRLTPTHCFQIVSQIGNAWKHPCISSSTSALWLAPPEQGNRSPIKPSASDQMFLLNCCNHSALLKMELPPSELCSRCLTLSHFGALKLTWLWSTVAACLMTLKLNSLYSDLMVPLLCVLRVCDVTLTEAPSCSVKMKTCGSQES